MTLATARGSRGATPLACDIKAISDAQRPRYRDLVKRLRTAMNERSDLPDGYAYSLDTEKISLPEVAEWITMERLCCPFLTFQLNVNGNGDSQLAMRGPEGVEAILLEEFPESD